MEYPADFDTSTFPAGKQVAVSRLLGVLVMVAFFAIFVLCGLIMWVNRSAREHPFLVSVNQITGQWDVVNHHHSRDFEISAYRSLQEAVAVKFIRNWFNISSDDITNELIWQQCDNRDVACAPDNNSSMEVEPCALYCVTSEDLFTDFTKNQLIKYQQRYLRGEVWSVDMSSLQLLPISHVGRGGATWQARFSVISNLSSRIDIFAILQIENNKEMFPHSLGFYVSEFNAYKVN